MAMLILVVENRVVFCFFCLMCERGGLSFLQMSEWTRQLSVMSDLEYATLFSDFQCQIRKYIEFEKRKMSAVV